MPSFGADVIKIFVLAAIASVFAVLWTPILTHFLYKYKLWKKEPRKKTITGKKASVFYNLHRERETRVPRFGGLLIWVTTALVIYLFYFLSKISDNAWLKSLNFLSRAETWLPLFTLVVASIVGFADDFLQVFGKGKYIAGGMKFTRRLLIVIIIGLIGGWWFYSKLDWDYIHIPLIGNFSIGVWYVPLFIVVTLACWSGGIVDGLDGLAGGVFAAIFGAFTIIAFWQGKIDLATFCGVISGTLFAFLWFNIPPARFYMGETGILGLTTTLAVVAFLTDSIVVLPIIAGILVLESGSSILQLLSKKFRKKKLFRCAPIHHHLEALGWPSCKVTMRFWVIGIVLAIIGTAVRLLG